MTRRKDLLKSVFAEPSRRSVIRVIIACLAAAWLLVQIAGIEFTMPKFNAVEAATP